MKKLWHETGMTFQYRVESEKKWMR